MERTLWVTLPIQFGYSVQPLIGYRQY
uniref:Uncharacterized protein n=1 Tax=Anguilla anguilla TaxID=7936 RepID=A0A0E9QB00_ANGAN